MEPSESHGLLKALFIPPVGNVLSHGMNRLKQKNSITAAMKRMKEVMNEVG